MLTVLAPAKINLTLEVLSARPDGYHEVRSVMQTVSLYDTLDFRLARQFSFKSGSPDWKSKLSLVAKAASLLREVNGGSEGATIEVTKRIPLMAGLGGDSSDAAATLRGLNALWGLGLSQPKLLELAARLGSDVTFFLHGGTALAKGRGEVVTPLPPLPRSWIVLVVPSVPAPPGKTAQLYASLNQNHYTDGHTTQGLVAALEKGRGVAPSLLFNTFENVAFDLFPGLEAYRSHILKLGADSVHLAGSGPALFTLMKDKASADDLYSQCREQGIDTYLVETC